MSIDFSGFQKPGINAGEGSDLGQVQFATSTLYQGIQDAMGTLSSMQTWNFNGNYTGYSHTPTIPAPNPVTPQEMQAAPQKQQTFTYEDFIKAMEGGASPEELKTMASLAYDRIFEKGLKEKTAELGLSSKEVANLRAAHYDPKVENGLAPQQKALLASLENRALAETQSTYSLPSDWQPDVDLQTLANKVSLAYDEGVQEKIIAYAKEKGLSETNARQMIYAHFHPDQNTLSPELKAILGKIEKEAVPEARSQAGVPTDFPVKPHKELFDALISGEFRSVVTDLMQKMQPPLSKNEQVQILLAASGNNIASSQLQLVGQTLAFQAKQELGLPGSFQIAAPLPQNPLKAAIQEQILSQVKMGKEVIEETLKLAENVPSSPQKVSMIDTMKSILAALNLAQTQMFSQEMIEAKLSDLHSKAKSDLMQAGLDKQKETDETQKANNEAIKEKEGKSEGVKTFLDVLSWVGKVVTVAVAWVALAPFGPVGWAIAAAVTVAVVVSAVAKVTGENYFGELFDAIAKGIDDLEIKPKWLGDMLVQVSQAIVYLPMAIPDIFSGFQILSSANLIQNALIRDGVDPQDAAWAQMGLTIALSLVSMLVTYQVGAAGKALGGVADAAQAADGAAQAANQAQTLATEAAEIAEQAQRAAELAQGTAQYAQLADTADKALDIAEKAQELATKAQEMATLAQQQAAVLSQAIGATKNLNGIATAAMQGADIANTAQVADASQKVIYAAESARNAMQQAAQLTDQASMLVNGTTASAQALAGTSAIGMSQNTWANAANNVGRTLQAKVLSETTLQRAQQVIAGGTMVGQGLTSIFQSEILKLQAQGSYNAAELEATQELIKQLTKLLQNMIDGLIESLGGLTQDVKNINDRLNAYFQGMENMVEQATNQMRM